MSDRVGMGVVGAGSIGIRAALQHLCLEDVQDRTWLAAVCDPVPGRAQAAAERYGVAHAYERYEDLLEDAGVDAVTLGSPIGVHYEQGLLAIRAGKHVHFNKTMTTTAAQATELIDEAAAHDVKLVASPGQMLRPLNLRIRKLIQEGALGRLAWAATGAAFGTYHENEGVRQGDDVLSNINPAWYWRKPGGGPLWDMTVYGLHSLTGILGPAKRVTGMSGVAVAEREFQGQVYPCDADDNTFLVLDFGDNVFGFVYGALAGMLSSFGQATIFGTRGSISGGTLNGQPIDYPGREEVEASSAGDNILLPHVVGPHRELGESHVFEDIMQLVDWAHEGSPSLATAEHARHVIEIFEAGYRAAETGAPQTLTTTFAPPEGA
ncbi:MAG: gfo/Idh/MocA family oxidoreductase [Armatimonadetes bacterium CG_4_9_14_3_um_filter_66_14]|nr:MAG: gfo/Idh/MocA family oxidoreductase [Armatimonadetes bacterium CG_4_8_14_3_um_filter_66_20]PJB61076.1 MAG: gfo/Idh/MocA family oxidoreductase [Armatimonadetes bacterium CG_4_9_14_3_um_filter_66_14]